MNEIQALSRAILEEYGSSGAVSAQSLDTAEFGVWDRVTPGLLLIGVAVLIDAEDPTLVEELRPGASALTAMLRDGPVGLALAEQSGTFRWDDMMALIQAYVSRPGTPPDALATLLTEAESLGTEIVRSGEVTRPRVRDGENGPWDAAENPVPADTERIDCGALKVPRLSGAVVRPLHEGDHTVGVVVDFAGHDLWLQVFRSIRGPAWDTVRPQLGSAALARGGTVTENRSSLGPELRARIPVTREGRRELLPTRLLGCDGPGWLLRGLFRGPDALAEVVDPRVHHLFTQTVVDLPPALADAAPDGTVVEVTMP
ncbi:DUF3710 domain-containing protein [Streptomyces sp. NPDC086033]|uniref:DUF3710 domain-containing protein n=1 Tax=Streptomyces sp. NPDC086033 TaxID=3365747 RepID=UPI0037CE1957